MSISRPAMGRDTQAQHRHGSCAGGRGHPGPRRRARRARYAPDGGAAADGAAGSPGTVPGPRRPPDPRAAASASRTGRPRRDRDRSQAPGAARRLRLGAPPPEKSRHITSTPGGTGCYSERRMAPSLSRRAVLRGLGASVASLAFPLRLDAVTASDPPAVCEGYRPHVAAGWVPAGEPGAFERALRGVVDAATDFAWLAPGDRVLVKVASNSGSSYPATSSPAALFALARLLYARGAGTVWVGDQAGVHLVHHTRNERKGSTRALMRQNGHWRNEVWIARAAAEADHIVYLPRVSHHTLAFATLGLKLGVGWLREDSRLELHR